ncbi:hypothetical protein [Clostridium sp. BSD9I1]|uniref:hypothetical protein n=1 Tax=Clostridium sp. BSD9I1 TaxID=2003589 RepID=UPI001FA86E11|nr:hypothetical protein [Clostridium sp. BSD9I1]
MYIDDFEDFYRADEGEFPEEFDSRDNFDEDDTFDEFEEFTEFEELDDFRNDNILRDFDDTDDINEFDEMNDLDDSKFTCQGVCPFYRQFPFFPPTSGPDGPGGPGRPGRPGRPGGPGQGNRPPSGPPPSVAPQQQLSAGGPQLYAVDPGSIRGCRFRFVYIWPRRGRGFWMWLTFVGRRSIAGWRWNGFTWFYFGMDLRRIESFRCY